MQTKGLDASTVALVDRKLPSIPCLPFHQIPGTW